MRVRLTLPRTEEVTVLKTRQALKWRRDCVKEELNTVGRQDSPRPVISRYGETVVFGGQRDGRRVTLGYDLLEVTTNGPRSETDHGHRDFDSVPLIMSKYGDSGTCLDMDPYTFPQNQTIYLFTQR